MKNITIMENETFVKPLPFQTIITSQNKLDVFEKTAGNFGIRTNFHRVDGCAYALEIAHKRAILLCTSEKNKELRAMVSRVATLFDFHVYLVEQVGAIGVLPSSIAIPDTNYLSEWDQRYYVQLAKAGHCQGKHVIFTERSPYLDGIPYNHLPADLSKRQTYLEFFCEFSRYAATQSQELIPYYSQVLRLFNSTFTGQEFLDFFRLTQPVAYASTIEILEGCIAPLGIYFGGGFHMPSHELLAQELLAQLFEQQEGVRCLDEHLIGEQGISMRSFVDLKLTRWQKIEPAR